MIKRNPGTTAFLVFVIGSFLIGYYAATIPQPYARTIVQCWTLCGIWVLTHYNVKWINRLMKRELEKRK